MQPLCSPLFGRLAIIALAIVLSACAAPRVPVPALPGKGIAVYTAGDIADCYRKRPADTGAAETAALVARYLERDPEAVVLTLGDHTYPVGLPAEFSECYEPTWGRFKNRTFPTTGNHEYYTKGAPGYFGYFGAAARPQGRSYYSFMLGGWQIISLDSMLPKAESEAQLVWLKTELERVKASCTLAYWHHPVYSSGGHGSSERMRAAWNLLVQAGAELLLSAHDHGYERFAPMDSAGLRDDGKGLRQFVVGTGGAQLTPLRFAKPNSEVNDNSTHGVLKLILKETGYEWDFLSVKPDGFADRGMKKCH